jgi:hypothetical protein
MRQSHLEQNLYRSDYTNDLFDQYNKHLGAVRYRILLEVQTKIVPQKVTELLGFRKISLLSPLLTLYKLSKIVKLDWILRTLLLPSKYKKEINDLDDYKSD